MLSMGKYIFMYVESRTLLNNNTKNSTRLCDFSYDFRLASYRIHTKVLKIVARFCS